MSDFQRGRREQAWAAGRLLSSHFRRAFCHEYGVSEAPSLALIIDEVLTDILGIELRFDPLPLDVYAETCWAGGRPRITVNSLIHRMHGVIDAEGVENVAKCHETVHAVEDLPRLQEGRSLLLPGFEEPEKITCLRSPGRELRGAALAREFWAEEAGRAAAICYDALAKSPAFRLLGRLEGREGGATGWQLVVEAARDIGVNRSALVKQLSLEGRIAVVKEGGRQRLYVQPGLADVVSVGDATE